MMFMEKSFHLTASNIREILILLVISSWIVSRNQDKKGIILQRLEKYCIRCAFMVALVQLTISVKSTKW